MFPLLNPLQNANFINIVVSASLSSGAWKAKFGTLNLSLRIFPVFSWRQVNMHREGSDYQMLPFRCLESRILTSWRGHHPRGTSLPEALRRNLLLGGVLELRLDPPYTGVPRPSGPEIPKKSQESLPGPPGPEC